MSKKYEVAVKSTYGSCESELFKKMAKKGDITADRIQECLGRVFDITGYAVCHIVTDEKEFDIMYYATDNGFISSGSEVLFNSIEDYIGDVSKFKIKEVKTKKGKTYKAVPVLVDNTTGEVYE